MHDRDGAGLARVAIPTRRQSGFTVIELMIAVVVVGVLAAVALPAFTDSIRKSRRSEAFAALSALQQAQERWRSNQSSYAGDSQLELPVTPASPTDPSGLGLSSTTPSGYYTITISGQGPTGYTATATAVAGKSQAADAGCQVMAVRHATGNPSYGSGTSSVDWSDPRRCWAR